MKVFQREQQLRTASGLEVRDITDEVAEAVVESGVREGIACVYSPHTTCCVRVNEYERGMFEDFTALLRRLIPPETYYAHDDWDRRTENICPEDMEAANGHAHCMSMILGSAGESIPVGDGELCMGQWQRVLFIELDRSRPRRQDVLRLRRTVDEVPPAKPSLLALDQEHALAREDEEVLLGSTHGGRGRSAFPAGARRA